MAEQVLVQFRVDKNLKQDVADICEALGLVRPPGFRKMWQQGRMLLKRLKRCGGRRLTCQR